jgi:hypothetical protein
MYVYIYIYDKLDDIWKKWHVIYDRNTLKKVWTREWLNILLPMENMSHFDTPLQYVPVFISREIPTAIPVTIAIYPQCG